MWLLIFPMSGNNTFETSDFTDPRFSLCSSEGTLLFPIGSLWKEFIAKQKQVISCVLSKEFSCTCFMTAENSKNKYLKKVEAATRGVLLKKVFLQISQYS